MGNVSVFGLGDMGSGFAKALVNSGHTTSVWNQTRSKVDNAVGFGAIGASTVVEAVDASDVIFVSMTNYSAARPILLTKEMASHVKDKTLMQISTGTPTGEYLDVIAEAYPDQIGQPDSRFLISGSTKVFDRVQPYLNFFGGDLKYLGENVGAANTMDLGELIYWFGQAIGFAHAAQICKAENVDLNLFGSLYAESDVASNFADMVHADNYAVDAIHHGASVATWNSVIQILQNHAKASNINSEILDFFATLFKRTSDAGYGEEDAAAVMKMLRKQ